MGPWKYDLPCLPNERYFAGGDGNIDMTMADINCDGYPCGGEFNDLMENRQ
jgi:hypothetical protein